MANKSLNELQWEYYNIGCDSMKMGSVVVKEPWSYAGPANGINVSTAIELSPAVVGQRKYLTGLDISNSAITGTDVVLLDGSTIVWRIAVGGSMLGRQLTFPTPIRSSVGASLSVRCLTAGAAVYFNAQGYTGP